VTSAIVTSTYRYKRPPRKRKPVPIEGPAVVTVKMRCRAAEDRAAAEMEELSEVARSPAGVPQSSTSPSRRAHPGQRRRPAPIGHRHRAEARRSTEEIAMKKYLLIAGLLGTYAVPSHADGLRRRRL
jgi:hypothetical protein